MIQMRSMSERDKVIHFSAVYKVEQKNRYKQYRRVKTLTEAIKVDLKYYRLQKKYKELMEGII